MQPTTRRPVTVPEVAYPYLPSHSRVQASLSEWKRFRDAYVSQVIQHGLYLDWVEGFNPSRPDPAFSPRPMFCNAVLPPEVDVLVEEMVHDGTVLEISPEEAHCQSSIFAVPKKDTDSWRLITNLRNINDFLVTTPFKLPTLQQILPFVRQGMWGAKVDLKSAYTHLPISERDKPWLVFQHQGKFYQHQALPFGLAVAPREWQRLMQPILLEMRRRGCLIWVYLDDFLILGASQEQVNEFTQQLVTLLASLGLQINVPKSQLVPTQNIQFLGFTLNLVEATITIPKHKLKATLDDLLSLQKKPAQTVRKLASVLGRLRALHFALPHVRLLSDRFSAHVGQFSRWGWDTVAPLPQAVLDQIHSSIQDLLSWKGHHFQRPLRTEAIYTDASLEGWGATGSSGEDCIWGTFPDQFQDFHINLKECVAATKAIQTYDIRNTTLHINTDSTTLYWYIRHWGGRSQKMNLVVRQLWEICQERSVHIIPHFVPSAANLADQPSRWNPGRLTETSLHPGVMDVALKWAHAHGLVPKWDWMASEGNAQFPRWISEEQDWFSIDLNHISPGWLNPPHRLIPHVLNRWYQFSPLAKALVVFPWKPNSAWWSMFLQMCMSPLLLVQNSWDLFLDMEGHPVPRWGGPLVFAILCGQLKHQHSSDLQAKSVKKRKLC